MMRSISTPSTADTSVAAEPRWFTGKQFAIVLICLTLNVIEGFDLLILSFSAGEIIAEWSLEASAMGIILSLGLVGMALGSILLAPLADRFGRRNLGSLCLSITAVGLLLSVVAPNAYVLGGGRVLAGLGIGGMVAILPVVLTESSPRRLRATAIGIYSLGLPLGGILGGLAAAALLSAWHWRGLFAVGLVLTVLMVIVARLFLPDGSGALRATSGAPRSRLRELFRGGYAVRTVLVWFLFFNAMAGVYFANSWIPQLLATDSSSQQVGISGGVLLNVGGLVAMIAFAALALRLRHETLTIVSFAGSTIAFLLMAWAVSAGSAVLAVAATLGLFVNAAGCAVLAAAPALYPEEFRATGVGISIGVGRLGAILAPAVVGFLVSAGWGADALFTVFAVPMAIATIAAVAIAVVSRR